MELPSISVLEMLYGSLAERRRPEDVAELVMRLIGDSLTPQQRKLLDKAARDSLVRQLFGYTSMLETFLEPVGCARQIVKANELFSLAYSLTPEQCNDPECVEQFIRTISAEIHKPYGRNNFLNDRLNGEQRTKAGLELSRRRYNKLFRHLQRLERKLATLVRQYAKREFQMVSKSRLAHRISWEDFSADPDTAAFVAYYAARCKLRSTFTNTAQVRPFDEIAAMLLERCTGSPTVRWWAIALVYPVAQVLGHLSDHQKGTLLGIWADLMGQIGALLKEIWDRSAIDRKTMTVRRGNDSTTWNNTAGAWNRARDAWIALVYSLGLEELLNAFCPGKVLRLMAADVVAWHRTSGGTAHQDTEVWNALPLPWEVLSGEVACTRRVIEATCVRYGVDPHKSGWTACRPAGIPTAYTPTPELVHGVEVSSPYLAKILRKAGYFSGKV